ncbi:Hypothetical predicted protein [Olea europaea subsp. europaea]|uniref:Uncharacterized protein n=1 Tax=Olea europaea subsp. europaea TaxID=158383 RepID=A0A8S0UIV1_OLEEU|nr:Hypothetical predicted protein [Olea europaea subsp. europaea]
MYLPTGKLRVQVVEYEHEPKFCANCKMLGHTTKACNTNKHGATLGQKVVVKNNQGKVVVTGHNVVDPPVQAALDAGVSSEQLVSAQDNMRSMLMFCLLRLLVDLRVVNLAKHLLHRLQINHQLKYQKVVENLGSPLLDRILTFFRKCAKSFF